MNVELIVDSTVDVPEHIRSRLTVVPLTIHFGQEEYLDGVTLDKHRFYERLVESDVLPTTSQASPAAFDREFRRVRRSGGSAVVLTISAGLSGTYQSAVTMGVTRMSTFVSLLTALPISLARIATNSTARGPPAPPMKLVAKPTGIREYSTRGGASSARPMATAMPGPTMAEHRPPMV